MQKPESKVLLCCSISLFIGCVAYGLSTLFAHDEATLKPLPKFLRSAKLADRYLSTRDIEDILKFERAEPVCLQLLKREGVPAKFRLEALCKLAEHRQSTATKQLLEQIELATTGEEVNPVVSDLANLIPQMAAEELLAASKDLNEMSRTSKFVSLRQASLMARIISTNSVESVWHEVSKDNQQRLHFLNGILFLHQEKLLVDLFDRVFPLIEDSRDKDVQAAAIKAIPYLKGDAKQVYATLANLIANGQQIPNCTRSILKIPIDFWDSDGSYELGLQILDWIDKMSIAERAAPDGKIAVQLVTQLSQLVSPADQIALQKRLRKSSVQIFDVGTIEEKMAYDKTVLVMDADRPVRIVFRNHDIMPHNLVVGSEPAARVELGLMADEMQNDKDALAKGYLPTSDLLLFASKLIQPEQTDQVDFVAPKAGVYPFVCTFPGHWSKMYGAIQVVDDSEAYLASNPTLPTADALLGIRKVEWKIEDLAVEIEQIHEGRRFDNGRRWFKQASCFSCHQVNKEGGHIGPDLTEIAKKYKDPNEILVHIMQPSKTIEDKFASVTIVDVDGLVHQGVVIRRTDEEVFVQKNPLDDCSPTVIRLEDIEEELKSKVSPMPEKLLNTIVEKTDIYDLLAYVISGGNPDAKQFQE